MASFVNRTRELADLTRWGSGGAALGVVYGRRRVGKTVLLAEFAQGRAAVHHIGANRVVADELRVLSRAVTAAGVEVGLRDLDARPFEDWTDAFEGLAQAAAERPLLVVLDEFPEMILADPSLESTLRAVWDRVRGRTRLQILLCGSAVRTMERMRQERAPLYGRLDLALHVHPFDPSEMRLLLPKLSPADRARVWGITGGMPLYTSWWDQRQSIKANLLRLVYSPSGLLKNEGDLLLATEGYGGGGGAHLPGQILRAVARGRTKFNEIKDAVKTDPTRTIASLTELRLLERVTPVTEGEASRRGYYRVADNFLGFWLRAVDPHRSQIERGLGSTIATAAMAEFDDLMGERWEHAVRHHLRVLAASGMFGDDVTALGPYWNDRQAPVEIDAVALAGRSRTAVMLGEVKWARTVDARRIEHSLVRKAASLPKLSNGPRLVVAARERVAEADPSTLVVTATDVFGDPEIS